MKFTKMHGIGNDYIYINGFEENIDNPCQLAIKLSHRNFGIGGDGIVIIAKSDVADAKMRMFNADGSEGLMCGNAIRCVGKYLYDNDICKKETLKIETKSGIKKLELTIENNKATKALVDMENASFKTKSLPMSTKLDEFIDETIEIEGVRYNCTAVSMGNPHIVVFLDDDIDNLQLKEIGQKFENHELFPQRVNTEFVNIIDEKTVYMRVWERGSGETLSCGTGACAVVCACIKKGLLKFDTDNTVRLLGGELIINVNSDYRVFMRGTATKVFEGEI